MNTVEQMREEYGRRRAEAFAREFFSRWAPTHPADRSRFEAEFYALMTEFLRQALEPFAEQYAIALSALPPQPIVIEK